MKTIALKGVKNLIFFVVFYDILAKLYCVGALGEKSSSIILSSCHTSKSIENRAGF